MIAIVIIALLALVAIGAFRTSRRASLTEGEKIHRFELRNEARANALGAILLIGLPILGFLYLLAYVFGGSQ